LPDFGALLEQILQRREHLERDSGLGTAVDDALQLGAAGRRDRDDEQLDTALDGEAAQIADAAQHAHAVQRSPVRVPVVVDETHDVQLVPLVVQQLAEQLLTRFTGADDEGPFRLRCLCLHQGADLARDADGEPEAAD